MKTSSSPRLSATPTPAQARVRAVLSEFFLFVMLAVSLLYTNRMFTFIDDEVNILSPAAQPNSIFLKSLSEIVRTHEHPPLYDLIIHFWLRVTGGAMDLIRVPAVIFFIVGLFCLSRSAKLLGGSEAGQAL